MAQGCFQAYLPIYATYYPFLLPILPKAKQWDTFLTILNFLTDGCTWGGKTGGIVWEDSLPLVQMDLYVSSR